MGFEFCIGSCGNNGRDWLAFWLSAGGLILATLVALVALAALLREEQGRRNSLRPLPQNRGNVEFRDSAVFITVENVGPGPAADVFGKAWIYHVEDEDSDSLDRMIRENDWGPLTKTDPHLTTWVTGLAGAGARHKQGWRRESSYPGDPPAGRPFILMSRFECFDIFDRKIRFDAHVMVYERAQNHA